MIINKANFQYYFAAVWIIGTVLYCIFIVPMCDHIIYSNLAIVLFFLSIIAVPFLVPDNCKAIIITPIISVIITSLYTLDYLDMRLKKGPTFVTKFYIINNQLVKKGNGKGIKPTINVKGYYRIGGQTINNTLVTNHYHTNNWEYVKYLLNNCHSLLYCYKENPTINDIDIINDFAFLENDSIYSYYDYSLKQTDLVYYQVGYNVLYNAVCDTSAIADSTALLSFTDVLGKDQTVKYSIKGYPSIPDTFLIYRNINENIDSTWHVCAPEVNTPENRAKISDYGYIFHYDVCSKQKIESQCPRIKDYVEQYKKRNQ